MNYSTIELTLSPDDARRRIAERVSGIRIKESGDGYTFESQVGFHLGVISEITLPNGDPGSRLRYRTVLLSPTAAHARQRAYKIKAAVEKYRYER